MALLQSASNPFALLLNPAAVFAELERSDRLTRLTSRICRPLDKPVLTGPEQQAKDEIESERDDDLLLDSGTVII